MKPTVEKKVLPARDVLWAKQAYARLFARALPHAGGLARERIEIAAFNLSASRREFARIGLGLEVVVIFRARRGEGHTGKVLMNLPGQLLPEHGHVDTFILRRAARVPPGFVDLRERINNFRGIYRYNSDGTLALQNGRPQFLYPAVRFVVVQAADGERAWPAGRARDLVATLAGKSETFKAIYGDGVLFADRAVVLHAPRGADPERIPAAFRAGIARTRREFPITTRRMVYMGPGTNVLLPAGTKHAFLAGRQGAVYLEFSTPSLDEADAFTDPRIIR